MTYRQAQGGLLAALLLHNLEEALTVGAYLQRSHQLAARFSWLADMAAHVSLASFGWTLVAVSIAGAVVVALGKRWPVLPVAMAWVLLVNVFVPHVPAAIAFGGYSPGVASAVLINLPYTVWFLRRSAREGVVGRR